VRLGKPRETGRDEWMCPFHFSRVVRPAMGRAFGIDAFQALIMGLHAIWYVLDRTGQRFAWNDWEAGETGFYCRVPTQMNGRYTRQFERLLERTVNKGAREGIRKLDEREARARRRKKAR
jgi:hypothetical protein